MKIITKAKRVLFCMFFLWCFTITTAAQTVPNVFVYEGMLFDSSNAPLTSTHEMRISLWKTPDVLPTDIQANGAINTGSVNFSDWKEVQVFKPDFNGAFSVYFGGVNPITEIDFSVHKYFQVEIKAQGAPDTDFEILDPTGDLSDALDRQEIGSVFYAKNAEYVAGHQPGDSAGNILVLDQNGQIAVKHIGNATNFDSFTLDKDNTSSGNVILNFGSNLGKSLFWNTVQKLFEFTDSLKINGDLMVTGDIISKEKEVVHEIVPRYPNATFDLDGVANVGSMYERREMFGGKKYPVMIWKSNESSFQDADTYIDFQLPKEFKRFQNNGLKVQLKTEGYSRVDIFVMKDQSIVDSMLNVKSNQFSEKSFTLPQNIFNAGETLTLKIKTYSKNKASVFLSKISIQTIE